MQHKSDGTASEVATYLRQLLSGLSPQVSEVTFYSNIAFGQNRNTIWSAMFLKTLSPLNGVWVFGYGMDTHSTIDNRGSKIDIFVPNRWYTMEGVVKFSNTPYVVRETDYTQFEDFKK